MNWVAATNREGGRSLSECTQHAATALGSGSAGCLDRPWAGHFEPLDERAHLVIAPIRKVGECIAVEPPLILCLQREIHDQPPPDGLRGPPQDESSAVPARNPCGTSGRGAPNARVDPWRALTIGASKAR